MKSFIVASSTFLFLIWAFLQGIQYDTIDYKQSESTNIVQMYAQQARQEGLFTESIKKEMIEKIKERTQLEDSSIEVVELTSTQKCRKDTFSENDQITYNVRILIDNVTIGLSLLGILPEDNQYWYTIKGSVSSEKVCE
ncbi:hypothetical protein LAV72_18700 [Lysinibacillus xylanilyticus]|uniref:hypothetical protein n=1 Tax=Lysinibacillus xylanilyticus TaxID=582475 RepID=UPI002B24E029|nr:hypothetical protein [Lysinibacillus xylanilyticus]MEB2301637.1 hypothetical protein [Lysinibacillus xylanilyticus]